MIRPVLLVIGYLGLLRYQISRDGILAPVAEPCVWGGFTTNGGERRFRWDVAKVFQMV